MGYQKILVVGAGYVGLVSAVCFSDLGHNVLCLDIDERKIARLSRGEVPMYEPGLSELLKKNLAAGRITATHLYEKALSERPSIIVIAVDTPTKADGHCDLSRVEAVVRAIGQSVQSPCTLLVKSTVPVGTNKHITALLREELKKRDISFSIDVVSNPEFLREGAAVRDFMHAERVIVGVRNERSEEVLRSLYAPLFKASPTTALLVMDPESSELTKYAANTMLAMRISFMNWLSQIAEKSGADIESIREGIGSDSRIGPSFLQAGLGFGGSCFPKDIRALRSIASGLGLNAGFVDVVESVNIQQRIHFSEKVITACREQNADGPVKIAVWGLSFKPNTDDMRDAPSLDIVRLFLEAGFFVALFDPVAMEAAQILLGEHDRILWAKSPKEAAHGADAIALVTEWELLKSADLVDIRANMKGNLFFDGRNAFSQQSVTKAGFSYHGIGRPAGVEVQEALEPAYCFADRLR